MSDLEKYIAHNQALYAFEVAQNLFIVPELAERDTAMAQGFEIGFESAWSAAIKRMSETT